MELLELVNFFIGLLIVCNPLSALPALLKLTHNEPLEKRRKTAVTTGLAVAVILVIVTWIGAPFLGILGVRIAAFQVAGGLIILFLALAMLNAQQSRIKQTAAEEVDAIDQESIAIIPLAMPLIAGPGAMSMIIVNSNLHPGVFNMVLFSLCALLVALVMGLILYFATTLERILGRVGINIFNRLGGLVLAAIGIESIAKGCIGLFPSLG